tara:strand:+ start:326 stop:1210 length:885 start_codon:yes stop_codon:yes gene_type:complete
VGDWLFAPLLALNNEGVILTTQIGLIVLCQQFLKSVGYLRGKNAEGYHVYFRPDARQFIFADDVCKDDIDAMMADSIRPVLVYETSEGLLHAWVQLANRSDQLTDQEATVARKIIAEKYGGDTAATGKDQLGRVPGLRNVKTKHEDANGGHPLVIIRRNAFAPMAHNLLAEAKEIVANSPSLPPSPLGHVLSANSWEVNANSSDMTLEEGQEIYDSTIAYLAEKFSWQLPINKGHRSDADLAVARSLLIRWNHDLKDVANDIAAVLLHGSDKAQEKGIKYVDHVVKAALKPKKF